MAQAAAQAAPKGTARRSLASAYLVLYNALTAGLRAFIAIRTLQLWSSHGNAAVWHGLNLWVRWSETLTVLEVIHAATGLVRSPPLTAALQVAGRNTIVWAITRNYPDVAAREWAYSSLLVAWNIADMARYLYFAIDRATGSVPSVLLWLRYNMFIILYPIGFCSEMRLVWEVIEPSRARNPMYQYLLWLGLSLYPPSIYVLYGHMLAQRSKARRQKKD